MKRHLTTLLLFIVTICYGQNESVKFKPYQLRLNGLVKTELKEQFAKVDFSELWTQTQNENVYGFIGNNYERMRIKFLSVVKQSSGLIYNVSGKSMVKNSLVDFQGVIKITSVRKYKKMAYGADDELKGKGLKGEFTILGEYDFKEDSTQLHSGIFKGIFKTDFYLDKNSKIHYNDIEMYADGYSNNEFVGQWISYNNKLVKRCNWGDYRIPNSGDLDIGAGEFSPNDKYLKNGWQTVRNMGLTGLLGQKAKLAERRKWWTSFN